MTGVYPPKMGIEARTKFRENVIRDLRSELIHLKSFQIRVITFGITGAGIFLGLIKEFGSSPQYCFFLPLAMIFPFWIIFFEKARTIARNIGFIRIQEKMCLSGSPEALIGFETAMHKYWSEKKDRLDNNEALRKKISDIIHNSKEIKKKMHASHYWFTTYIVFFTFSFICLAFSILIASSGNIPSLQYTLPLILSVIFIFIAYFQLKFFPSFQKEGGHYLIAWIAAIVIIMSAVFFFHPAIDGIFTVQNYIVVPAQSPLALDTLYYPIYLVITGIFNFVSLFTFWFFYNLVKGRYTHSVFIMKWCEILNLNSFDILTTENPDIVDTVV